LIFSDTVELDDGVLPEGGLYCRYTSHLLDSVRRQYDPFWIAMVDGRPQP
jgi:hypothetical protein